MTYSSSEARAIEKILFVANELGNFWHHRSHLLRAARNSGFRAILIASPVGQVSDSDFEFLPVELERYRFHLRLDLVLFFTVLRALLREQPKVVHLINIKPYLFGGLAAQLARLFGWRGRIVITVPGLGRLYMRMQNEPLGAKIRRFFVETFLRIATRNTQVTFETDHDRDIWLQHKLIGPNQASVMRGTGIDLSYFSPPREFRESGKLRVLFAGRLMNAKGLDVFLEAASLLNDPEIEMFVAGFVEDDPDSLPLDAIQSHLGITYLGVVEDMRHLLSETDVVVLPSRYNEGVPRILIEAASMGCIPVATRFPGSEVLIEHGRTGYFLHAATIDTQVSELIALLNQLAGDRMTCGLVRRNAVAHIRDGSFDADALSEEFLALYNG